MSDRNQPPPTEPTLAPTTDSVPEEELIPHEELLRRYRNQYDLLKEFSACLDGIPEIRCIPGASIEGCRMPDDIRRIVTTLVAHCQTTWEDGWQGRAKLPNNQAQRPALGGKDKRE